MDHEFPPNNQCMIGKSRHDQGSTTMVRFVKEVLPDVDYKRVGDIFKNIPTLFPSPLSTNIEVGELKDRYLQYALSCLAEKEGLVKRLFNNEAYN